MAEWNIVLIYFRALLAFLVFPLLLNLHKYFAMPCIHYLYRLTSHLPHDYLIITND